MNHLRNVIPREEMEHHTRQRKILLTSERVDSTTIKLDHCYSGVSTYNREM